VSTFLPWCAFRHHLTRRDPKPLPPQLKLTKQMVEAMGGPRSPYYRDFLVMACQSFTLIRRNASLYLDLLTLMKDAGIQSMAGEPDRAIDFVANKLRPDLGEEDAEVVLLEAIEESVAAMFPLVVDFIHTVATSLR
jgi:phosphatidylinositol 3-kinase